jgi:hypothetical protein
MAGMTRAQILTELTKHGVAGHRCGERSWRRDLDTLFDSGTFGDTHGTVYSRTTTTGREKVYTASMPLHLVTPPPSTPDTPPPIPGPTPGPGPEV